jgi:hypothetical protein
VDRDLENVLMFMKKVRCSAGQRVSPRADLRIDRQRTQTTRQSFDLLGLVKPTPEWTHGNCFLFFLTCCE